MRASIHFTHPDKKLAILTKLLDVIKGIKNLRQHILANGILLERLSAREVENLKTVLSGSNYCKCITTSNSFRALIASSELRALFELVTPIARKPNQFSSIFWERGFTIEKLAPDKAEDLRKQLEPIAIVTISSDIPQTRINTVSGQVGLRDGSPLGAAGFTVCAFDSPSANSLVRCGSTSALQADGFYRIDYAWQSDGREGPDLLVRVFDQQGNIVAETKKTSASIQEFIDITAEDLCIVRGTVRHTDGSVLPDIIVRAFDRDLRAEALLGQTVTDAGGFYEINYSTRHFCRAEKPQADLIIRLYQPDREVEGNGEGEEIAISSIAFDAPLQHIVDLEVESRKFLGPSEYERHLAELQPLLESESAHELTDEDLSFLNGKTSIPFEQLNQLRLDAQWSFRYALMPAVCYGLFRQGLPANFRRLSVEKPSRLRDALKASLAANIVPAGIASQMDQGIEQLQSLADSQSFDLNVKAK